MADKIYNIKINGIKESAEEVASLGELLDKMNEKVLQQVETFDKDYAKALELNKQRLKELNKEVKEAAALEKAEQTIVENNTSTYKKKQELLTALGKVIKNMTTNTKEEIDRQNQLKAQYAQLNAELKKFDETLGNHQRSVGDYRGALRDMNAELKGIEGEMASMLANGVSKNDEAFKALAKRAGEISDAIGDAREEVKRFASDTKALDNVIGVAQAATAAFGLFKGAMSMFGVETENAEKAIQALAASMSVIQSLKTLQEVMQQGGVAAKLLNAALKLTGVELITTQANAIKAAAANSALTASEKASAVASKSLGMALKAIPLMLVISLVVDLVNHWEDFCGWLKESGVDIEALGGYLNKFISLVKGVGRAITTYLVGSVNTFITATKQFFSGDFTDALDTIKNGMNLFQKAWEAGVNEFQDSELKREKNAAAERAEIRAKETKDALDDLKAQYGDKAKYTKKGVELQRKYYKEMREAANGNADKLKEINREEMTFERELREKNLQDYQKYIADKQRLDEEAAKRAKELKDLENSISNLTYSEQLRSIEQSIRVAERTVEGFREGPVEKYKSAMVVVRELMDFKNQTKQLQEASSAYEKFAEIVGNVTDELVNDYLEEGDTFASDSDKMGGFLLRFIGGDLEEVKKRINYHFKDLSDVSKLKLQQLLMELRLTVQAEQSSFDEEVRKLFETEGVNVKNIGVKEGEELIKGVENGLKHVNTEYVSNFWNKILHPERFKNVQSHNEYIIEKLFDNSKKARISVSDAWEDYIDWIKEAGASETQVSAATNAMNESLQGVYDTIHTILETENNANGGGFSLKSFFFGGSSGEKIEDWLPQDFGEATEKFAELLEDVSDPIFNLLDTINQYEVEAARDALEQIEELHEKSLDRLDESKDKIDEIRDQMKDASASELETLKQQMADEMLLLAQREAEEKRLAREEERRKADAEKAEKKQKKTQLKADFIQAIANAAMAYTQTAKAYPFPMGNILGGIALALGMAQALVIQKQIQKLGKGGILGEDGVAVGKPHSQGGIKVLGGRSEIEGGEMVVNKRDTTRYYDILQKINNNDPSVRYLQGNSGTVHDHLKKKYADGGTLDYKAINASMEAESIAYAVRAAVEGVHPQVSVVDICKGISNLTQVRQMAGADKL